VDVESSRYRRYCSKEDKRNRRTEGTHLETVKMCVVLVKGIPYEECDEVKKGIGIRMRILLLYQEHNRNGKE